MIDHIAEILEEYPGSANRTRCFAHILNLVAKCVMRQFDDPRKSKAGESSSEDDEDGLNSALKELMDEVEHDDEDEGDSGEDGGGENIDGREGMTAAEIKELEDGVKPVRRVLAKVRRLLLPNHPYLDLSTTILTYLRCRCERQHTQSRTQARRFSLNGSRYLPRWLRPARVKARPLCQVE